MICRFNYLNDMFWGWKSIALQLCLRGIYQRPGGRLWGWNTSSGSLSNPRSSQTDQGAPKSKRWCPRNRKLKHWLHITVYKNVCSAVADSLGPHGLQPSRLLRPWDFPGKSTGVGCHCLWVLILACVCVLSRARLFATAWTVDRRAPLSMELSRQEYWSGLPFPTQP